MLKAQSPILHKLLAVLMLTFVIVMCRTDAFANEQQVSEARLAQLLAPVALYPDSLLTHILIASTYPLEVVEAERWRKKNKHLGETLLIARAEDKDWDPSVKALLPFPDILERMSDELQWTSDLGDAFLAEESLVLGMVQSLRREADDAGNLQQMENVTVTRVEREIIIESASPQIVYVPYYDPRVVYPYWRWPAYPPVWWSYNPVWFDYGYPGRLFYWRPGIHISFNFFFGSVHWHNRHVVVHRPGHYHHRPHYRHRIASSHGAKRWHHNPHHRKGIRYADHRVHDRVYRHHNKLRVAEGQRKLNREFKQHRARDMQHRTRQQLNSPQYRDKQGVYRPRDKAGISTNRLDKRHQPSSKDRVQGRRDINQPRKYSVQRRHDANQPRKYSVQRRHDANQPRKYSVQRRHNTKQTRKYRVQRPVRQAQRQVRSRSTHSVRQAGRQRSH